MLSTLSFELSLDSASRGLTSLNLSCGTMLDKNQLQGAARPWRQLLVLAVLTGPSLLCYSVNVQVLSTAAMVPGL